MDGHAEGAHLCRAVEGHFDHPHGRSWMYIADTVHPFFAELVGTS